MHIRNGKLLRKTSGQGNRCFKRPNDTVILVPTSLKQLTFQASQLTRFPWSLWKNSILKNRSPRLPTR